MLVFCRNMNFTVFVLIHWKRQNSSPLQYNSYETLSFTPVVETHSKCWSCAVPPRYLSSFWLLIHHRCSDYSHDLPHRRQASSTPICQLYSGGGRSLPLCICMSLYKRMEYVWASDTLVRVWSVLHYVLGDLLHFSTFIKYIVLSICIKIIYRLPQNFYDLNQIHLGMSSWMFHSCRWKNILFQLSLG